MNKKKKEREKRVKKKVQTEREALRKLRKKPDQDRFAYLSKVKKTPKVKDGDSALVRNNKTLQKMLAEHEAFVKFREENKHKADELYEHTKEEQAKIILELENNGRDEQRDDPGLV